MSQHRWNLLAPVGARFQNEVGSDVVLIFEKGKGREVLRHIRQWCDQQEAMLVAQEMNEEHQRISDTIPPTHKPEQMYVRDANGNFRPVPDVAIQPFPRPTAPVEAPADSKTQG